MKKYVIVTVFLMSVTLICGCSSKNQETISTKSDSMSTQTTSDVQIVTNMESDGEKMNKAPDRKHEILLSVNGEKLSVSWENNRSVDALRELLQKGSIIVNMRPYGGFEQVGSLPESIISDDVQFTTAPGDIVLYSRNSIVLFYGTNSWTYTKLGHIEGSSVDELQTLLDCDNVIAELSFIE